MQYNLCNEPWLKFSIGTVADRGLKASQWTGSRLSSDVLYVETHRWSACQVVLTCDAALSDDPLCKQPPDACLLRACASHAAQKVSRLPPMRQKFGACTCCPDPVLIPISRSGHAMH